MIAERDLEVLESAGRPASECEACVSEIAASQGLTVRSGDRTTRCSCPACQERYRVDPGQSLAATEAACCDDQHMATSPASEWCCDRA